MAINGEREQMMRGMRAAFKMLKPGGVIAVISWKHSEVSSRTLMVLWLCSRLFKNIQYGYRYIYACMLADSK